MNKHFFLASLLAFHFLSTGSNAAQIVRIDNSNLVSFDFKEEDVPGQQLGYNNFSMSAQLFLSIVIQDKKTSKEKTFAVNFSSRATGEKTSALKAAREHVRSTAETLIDGLGSALHDDITFQNVGGVLACSKQHVSLWHNEADDSVVKFSVHNTAVNCP